jgi:hypothetical protein
MKTTSLRRRIEALEKQVIGAGSIILFMPEGSRRAIPAEMNAICYRAPCVTTGPRRSG